MPCRCSALRPSRTTSAPLSADMGQASRNGSSYRPFNELGNSRTFPGRQWLSDQTRMPKPKPYAICISASNFSRFLVLHELRIRLLSYPTQKRDMQLRMPPR